MQKVFVILLLSFSTCLSQPSDPKDAAKVNITAPAAKISEQAPIVVETTVKPAANISQNPSGTNATDPTEHVNATDATGTVLPTIANANTSKADGENKTTDKKQEVVTPKADERKDESQKIAVVPATNESIPKSGASPQESKAKVDPAPPKNDVTPKPNVTTTTVPPKAGGDKPVLQARGFDGPSFIGGIILTLGLLAIGFMGFKYYKNQTERNYHTL